MHYNVEGSHQAINLDEIPDDPTKLYTIQQIQDYFHAHLSEVIVVVEGIDPLASGTFQALQSYRYEDIVFGQVQFQECIKVQKLDDQKDNKQRGWMWNKGNRFQRENGSYHRTRNDRIEPIGKKLVVDLKSFHTILPEAHKEVPFSGSNDNNNNENLSCCDNDTHASNLTGEADLASSSGTSITNHENNMNEENVEVTVA